jgi:hypothetical protein
MLGWVEKFLGGWLSKQLDRLVSFVWRKFQSYYKGSKHKSEVDKYVELIERLSAKAKAEAAELGRVSDATEKEIKLAMERRNRGIPYDEHYSVQDDTRN